MAQAEQPLEIPGPVPACAPAGAAARSGCWGRGSRAGAAAALTGITGGSTLSAARVDGDIWTVEPLVIRGMPPALQRSRSRHYPTGY